MAEKKRIEKESAKEAGKNPLSLADSLFAVPSVEKETGPKRTDFAPTPGGERRYIRALRAATPRKIKGAGAVYAPNNSGTVAPTVVTAKNAVAAAKDAQVTYAPHADNVAAQGATQTNTESTGLSWLWLLLIPTVIAARWAFNRLTS